MNFILPLFLIACALGLSFMIYFSLNPKKEVLSPWPPKDRALNAERERMRKEAEETAAAMFLPPPPKPKKKRITKKKEIAANSKAFKEMFG
jgi:hypothetical protein